MEDLKDKSAALDIENSCRRCTTQAACKPTITRALSTSALKRAPTSPVSAPASPSDSDRTFETPGAVAAAKGRAAPKAKAGTKAACVATAAVVRAKSVPASAKGKSSGKGRGGTQK